MYFLKLDPSLLRLMSDPLRMTIIFDFHVTTCHSERSEESKIFIEIILIVIGYPD
jgi:hypothetical protein